MAWSAIGWRLRDDLSRVGFPLLTVAPQRQGGFANAPVKLRASSSKRAKRASLDRPSASTFVRRGVASARPRVREDPPHRATDENERSNDECERRNGQD